MARPLWFLAVLLVHAATAQHTYTQREADAWCKEHSATCQSYTLLGTPDANGRQHVAFRSSAGVKAPAPAPEGNVLPASDSTKEVAPAPAPASASTSDKPNSETPAPARAAPAAPIINTLFKVKAPAPAPATAQAPAPAPAPQVQVVVRTSVWCVGACAVACPLPAPVQKVDSRSCGSLSTPEHAH